MKYQKVSNQLQKALKVENLTKKEKSLKTLALFGLNLTSETFPLASELRYIFLYVSLVIIAAFQFQKNYDNGLISMQIFQITAKVSSLFVPSAVFQVMALEDNYNALVRITYIFIFVLVAYSVIILISIYKIREEKNFISKMYFIKYWVLFNKALPFIFIPLIANILMSGIYCKLATVKDDPKRPLKIVSELQCSLLNNADLALCIIALVLFIAYTVLISFFSLKISRHHNCNIQVTSHSFVILISMYKLLVALNNFVSNQYAVQIIIVLLQVYLMMTFLQDSNFCDQHTDRCKFILINVELFIYLFWLVCSVVINSSQNMNTIFLQYTIPFYCLIILVAKLALVYYDRMQELVVTQDDAKASVHQKLRKLNMLYQYLCAQKMKGSKINYGSTKQSVALLGAFEMHCKYCRVQHCGCKNDRPFYYDGDTQNLLKVKEGQSQISLYKSLTYVKTLFMSIMDQIVESKTKDFDCNFARFCFMFFELKQFYKASTLCIYFRKMNKLSIFQELNFIMLASSIDLYLYELNLNLQQNQGYSYCDFYKITLFEINYKKLLFLVNEEAYTKLKYFKEIDSDEPSFNELESSIMMCKAISKEMSKCFQTNKCNPLTLAMYIDYINKFGFSNSKINSQDLKILYQNRIQEYSKLQAEGKHFSNIELMYNDESVLIMLNSTRQFMGQICDINQGGLNFFEYNKDEIVKQDIAIVCPPRIAAKHTTYMESFMNTGKPNVSFVERLIFARKKSGYLAFCTLLIKPVFDSNSLLFKFAGYLQPLEKQNSVFFVSDDNGNIDGLDIGFASVMSLFPNDFENTALPYSIMSIIPSMVCFFLSLKLSEAAKKTHADLLTDLDCFSYGNQNIVQLYPYMEGADNLKEVQNKIIQQRRDEQYDNEEDGVVNELQLWMDYKRQLDERVSSDQTYLMQYKMQVINTREKNNDIFVFILSEIDNVPQSVYADLYDRFGADVNILENFQQLLKQTKKSLSLASQQMLLEQTAKPQQDAQQLEEGGQNSNKLSATSVKQTLSQKTASLKENLSKSSKENKANLIQQHDNAKSTLMRSFMKKNLRSRGISSSKASKLTFSNSNNSSFRNSQNDMKSPSNDRGTSSSYFKKELEGGNENRSDSIVDKASIQIQSTMNLSGIQQSDSLQEQNKNFEVIQEENNQQEDQNGKNGQNDSSDELDNEEDQHFLRQSQRQSSQNNGLEESDAGTKTYKKEARLKELKKEFNLIFEVQDNDYEQTGRSSNTDGKADQQMIQRMKKMIRSMDHFKLPRYLSNIKIYFWVIVFSSFAFQLASLLTDQSNRSQLQSSFLTNQKFQIYKSNLLRSTSNIYKMLQIAENLVYASSNYTVQQKQQVLSDINDLFNNDHESYLLMGQFFESNYAIVSKSFNQIYSQQYAFITDGNNNKENINLLRTPFLMMVQTDELQMMSDAQINDLTNLNNAIYPLLMNGLSIVQTMDEQDNFYAYDSNLASFLLTIPLILFLVSIGLSIAVQIYRMYQYYLSMKLINEFYIVLISLPTNEIEMLTRYFMKAINIFNKDYYFKTSSKFQLFDTISSTVQSRHSKIQQRKMKYPQIFKISNFVIFYNFLWFFVFIGGFILLLVVGQTFTQYTNDLVNYRQLVTVDPYIQMQTSYLNMQDYLQALAGYKSFYANNTKDQILALNNKYQSGMGSFLKNFLQPFFITTMQTSIATGKICESQPVNETAPRYYSQQYCNQIIDGVLSIGFNAYRAKFFTTMNGILQTFSEFQGKPQQIANKLQELMFEQFGEANEYVNNILQPIQVKFIDTIQSLMSTLNKDVVIYFIVQFIVIWILIYIYWIVVIRSLIRQFKFSSRCFLLIPHSVYVRQTRIAKHIEKHFQIKLQI